jgi:multiple sugar transport system permease protein
MAVSTPTKNLALLFKAAVCFKVNFPLKLTGLDLLNDNILSIFSISFLTGAAVKITFKFKSCSIKSIILAEILSSIHFVDHVLISNNQTSSNIIKSLRPNFYFDKTSMEVNYNFIEVIQNIFQNYVDAWNSAPFGIYFMNSVLVAGTSTIVEVIFAILAAFAFAKLEFAGREFLFALLLMTMMIPGEVLLVPNYISLTKLGWIDTYYALITPWLVSVFTIFLMRQFFMSIPQELFEAAKIDGCSPTRFLWQILVPLSKPVIVTAALLKFVGSWNSFLWVLIVTKSPNMRTLPVGLQNFQSEAGTDYNLLMAASAISIIPVLIIFFFAQKQFIRGIAKTGIK